ncbi:MAG: MBL fold metallo-hydrolase [Polyangiaceae bacterium]|nr:MBL fold metallo-hydrolase [Polyangiaceae bacterium]
MTDPHERQRRIAASPAWNGKAFQNREPTPMMVKGGGRLMARFLFERAQREPPGPLPSVAVDPAVLHGAALRGLRVTWLGHSTTLVEIGGFRVLFDPVWSERLSPIGVGGPRRFQPVPVALEGVPLPDVVVVSHDHYDHLDRPTVEALAARGARFVTALGVGAHLERWGIAPGRVRELDWHESTEPVPGLVVRALPARHFSGRGLFDRNRTLWASFALEAGGRRLYFGGDGGFDAPAFAEIGARFGPFDLTLLEIGAFDPAWGAIHLGPDNAVRAHVLLRGRALLPVHWGTFNLGLHAWDAPIEELCVAARAAEVELALPAIGASVVVGEALPVAPWWRVLRAAAPREQAQVVPRSASARAAGAPRPRPAPEPAE